MNPNYSIVARKYAAAFLSAAGDAFTEADFFTLQQCNEFIQVNRPVIFYLNLPLIKKPVIGRVLDQLFGSCATLPLLKKLVVLLMQHHRAFLLPEVLHQISDLYKRGKKVTQFTITSSHALDDAAQQVAVQFLERETHMRVLYDYKVDPSLIAGIRLQSDTVLWEHSVKKQLNSARLALRA
jgi:F-type H+-transporting ATPase subunit delta